MRQFIPDGQAGAAHTIGQVGRRLADEQAAQACRHEAGAHRLQGEQELRPALYGYGHDGYWEDFNTMYYNYLTSNHSVVLLSNRGKAIDLDKFREKLSGLIDNHAED